ncbi:MAG: S9 family peptidase [Calditrichia bacterium]
MRWILVIAALLLNLISGLAVSHPDSLTIDWIYSSDRSRAEGRIYTHWLQNDRLLIYDYEIEDSLRTLEVLHPENDKRVPLFNEKKALVSLKKLLKENCPEKLRIPAAVSPLARFLVYRFENDLFLLNTATEEFTRITHDGEYKKRPEFSPDGKKIAYIRENNLYVYLIEEGREHQLTQDGSETILNGTLSWVYWEEVFGRHDIAYWWAPNSQNIAFLQTNESEVPLVQFSDFKPQTPRIIKQRYPKAGQKNPEVRVGVVSLKGDGPLWIPLDTTSNEYIVRVKWLPDAEHLAVEGLNRAQDTLTVYLAKIDGSQPSVLFSETDPGWVNIHDDLYFLPKKKQILWASERTGYNHLYRYSYAGKFLGAVTKGEWSLRSSGGGVAWTDQSVCFVDSKREWIYFTALEKSSVERHLYRIKLDGKKMSRLTREDGTHQISFSPQGKYYIDWYSSHNTPPVVRIHKSNGKLLKVLCKPKEDIAARFELTFPEIFSIPARDGFQMPASLLKPVDFDPSKKYPVIVYVYGGPAAPTVKDSWSYSLYWENILAKNGYLVFRVDNRSASAIAKKYTNTVLKQVMGEVELNDFIDGMEWLKKQSFVDTTRLGIWGWSGGGTHTLMAMTRTDYFKAGIAVAAVTNWKYYDTRYAEFAMKTPQVNPEGYEKTDLVNRAADLHGRLLLVHGTYDDNVHIQNAWAFTDELIRHNVQFDMMIYPMRKHGISDRAARIHLYTKMLEFWKNNL